MAAGNTALPSSLWLKVSQWNTSPRSSFCFHNVGTSEDSPTSFPFLSTLVYHMDSLIFFFKPGFWTSVLLTFWAGCSLCWGHSVHYGKLRLSHRFLVILVLTHDSRCPCRLQLDTNVLNWLHYFLPLHVIFFLDELLLYRKSYQVIFHQNKTNNTKQKTPLLVSLIAEGQWSCWKRAIPMAGSADNCWEFICLVS